VRSDGRLVVRWTGNGTWRICHGPWWDKPVDTRAPSFEARIWHTETATWSGTLLPSSPGASQGTIPGEPEEVGYAVAGKRPALVVAGPRCLSCGEFRRTGEPNRSGERVVCRIVVGESRGVLRGRFAPASHIDKGGSAMQSKKLCVGIGLLAVLGPATTFGRRRTCGR